jgi:hypothetical protein
MPIENPFMSRAIRRPARLFDARKTTGLTIAIPSAGRRRRRRP